MCEQLRYCGLECAQTHWNDEHHYVCPRTSSAAVELSRKHALELNVSEGELRKAVLHEQVKVQKKRETEREKEDEQNFFEFAQMMQDQIPSWCALK